MNDKMYRGTGKQLSNPLATGINAAKKKRMMSMQPKMPIQRQQGGITLKGGKSVNPIYRNMGM